jgi:N-acetylglucosaminyl-diphospho-decaprenol L-rhamnosyltransferase
MSDPAGLDVAIVSFRSRELLRSCLSSLRAHPPSCPMEVVVVDNASGDGTAEMVRADFPEVELIASPVNLGFAAATNLAARRGRHPYLLALNPDTAVTEGALDAVLETLAEHPEAAVAGARLLRPDGSLDHASKRSFPTPLSALGHFTGAARLPGAPARVSAYTAPEIQAGPVEAVNGAFMLMRRSAFESVGGFDEGYWMYMEDLDLCYALAQRGWRTWYEPRATVVHVKGGTTGGRRSPRLNWAFHLGMYRFYRKHYAPQRNPAMNVLVYVGIAVKLAAAIVRAGLRSAGARLRRREA